MITKAKGKSYEPTSLKQFAEELLESTRREEFGWRSLGEGAQLIPYSVIRLPSQYSLSSIEPPFDLPPEDDLAAQASLLAQVGEAPHPTHPELFCKGVGLHYTRLHDHLQSGLRTQIGKQRFSSRPSPFSCLKSTQNNLHKPQGAEVGLVGGSSRRIMITRFRPANIRLIDRRSILPRLLLALSSKEETNNDKNNHIDVQRLTGHSILWKTCVLVTRLFQDR